MVVCGVLAAGRLTTGFAMGSPDGIAISAVGTVSAIGTIGIEGYIYHHSAAPRRNKSSRHQKCSACGHRWNTTAS